MDFDETSSNTFNTNANQEGVGELDDLLFLEKDISEQQFYPSKEVIIFLIDCSPSMLNIIQDPSQNQTTTPLSTLLKSTENFLKTKIISNQNDLFSMVLFNTEIKNNEMDFDGVNVLFKVEAPNALNIKKIKMMAQNCDPEVNKDKFQQELNDIFRPLQNAKNNFLNNAIWVVHSMLKNYDKKNFKRRIFIFTDNDDPIPDDRDKNVCIQRAKDMNDGDIMFEIFPMNFDNKRFNLNNFYAQIIPANSDDDLDGGNENIFGLEQCADRLRELTKRIRQKEMKKRTLGKCPFFLTNNTKIYMNIYSCIKKSTKGRIYNVDAKTNKLLKSVTSLICKDTGGELYPEQVGTYQLYGNKKIIFSKEEMNKIKFLEEPGMKLLGFKSIESIKPYYNIRESYFIYPNELYSNGSSKLIDALIKQMLNKNKCAIVKFISREGSAIKLCALIPQAEKYDEDYFQTPPGFNMIVLPWADDIRSNSDIMAKNPKELPQPSDTQNELAKKIIKKMNISFDCRAFENYELQKFYATLQALALEEENIEPIEDTLQPSEEGLEKVLNGADDEFREAVFGNSGGKPEDVMEKYAKGNRYNNKNKSRSKSNESKNSRSQSKKRKKKTEKNDDEEEKEENDFSDELVKKMAKNNKLDKLKVDELRNICKKRNINTKGLKKADIIQKIRDYLDDAD